MEPKTEVNILMDTGPSGEALINNVDKLGVELEKTDVIVLSHGHYDHVNGLIAALERIGKQVPVIAHPKVFGVKLKTKPKIRFIGASFNASQIKNTYAVPVYAMNSITIVQGIATSGEIPRTTPYENTEGFWTVTDYFFKKDPLIDDQALYIKMERKGIVIITGCAHAGIVNTIKHAQKIMGKEKIYAVLGGFHLVNASKQRIRMTIDKFVSLRPAYVGLCHCTGTEAVEAFKKAMPENCHVIRTGDTITL